MRQTKRADETLDEIHLRVSSPFWIIYIAGLFPNSWKHLFHQTCILPSIIAIHLFSHEGSNLKAQSRKGHLNESAAIMGAHSQSLAMMLYVVLPLIFSCIRHVSIVSKLTWICESNLFAEHSTAWFRMSPFFSQYCSNWEYLIFAHLLLLLAVEASHIATCSSEAAK